VRLDLLTSEAVHRVQQRPPHAAIVADLQPCLVHVELGMAIVGNVAQANGGTIEVRTGQDGSTFTLAFPPEPRGAGLVVG
jgi:hypothetical protein